MCVFLVCVLALFRASVCAFRVSELLVVRLSFVVKLFRLRRVSCEILKFSCRILKSNFEFDFFVSLLYSISRISLLYSISRISIFDSSFEFKSLDFSSRICRRNFRCLAPFDFSNLDFRFEFVVEISRRNFRCLALFDFSNVVEPFDFSNFDFSIQVP